MNRARKGFTLVEILVVIVIIATLAVVGFSLSTTMMRKARITSSTANLKNLATAAMTWQSDNQIVLPYLFDTQTGGNSPPYYKRYWHVQLLPYLGFPEVTSASDLKQYEDKRPPGPFADPTSKQVIPKGEAHFRFSDYGRNPAVAQYPGTPSSPNWDPVKIRYRVQAPAIQQPHRIFMFMPSYDLLPDVYAAGGEKLARDVSRYGPEKPGTKIPVSFFDGHVEMLERGQIEGTKNQSKWYGDFKN
jgi:prepilin-type N-terminal cleavage/methylation domain-containing protein/prepilin-type processing-associated H-X9-DG protein